MTDIHFNLQERDYSQLGLTANPFPYAGIPDAEPDIYVGQESVIKTINSVISGTITTGKSSHMILTGSYGNGKSHTLKYLQSKVRKLDYENVKPIAAYVTQPGEVFLDIYRECIYDLGADLMKNVSRQYLGMVCFDLYTEGMIDEIIEPGGGWKAIETGRVLLSDIVPQALIRLNRSIKFPDFSRAFLNLAYEENSITSWEWLCGEAIEYTRRRELKLTTNIGNRHAQRAFLALKTVLQETGYSPFLLFIDEFEYIESLPGKAKQQMLNSVRHLIDTIPTGLTLIIACAPEIWETMLAEYHAFSERIAYEVNLRPLMQENVQILVASYLNRCREIPSDSIEPFSESGLLTAFEHGNGNARRIITICSRAIDNAVEVNSPIIDQEIVLSVLEK